MMVWLSFSLFKLVVITIIVVDFSTVRERKIVDMVVVFFHWLVTWQSLFASRQLMM